MTATTHIPAAGLRRAQQDTAVAAAATGIVSVERGQLRLARCISEIAVAIGVVDRLLPSGLVVVLTSNQDLVGHVAAWWTRAHPDAAYVVTSGSHGSSGLPSDVLFTTSPDLIAARVRAETATLRVLVGQHRQADLVGEGLLKAGGWADLLIVHEAHRTAGYAKRRAAVHDDTVLPAAARLYTTAAPRLFRRANTPAVDPDEVALSMDEEEVFGPVLHEYGAEQAITDGVAARVRLRINALPHPASGYGPTSPTRAAARDESARDVGIPQAFCIHRSSRTIKVALAEALTPDVPVLFGQDCSCCNDSTADVAIALTHPEASYPDTAITATVTATITPALGAATNDCVEVVRTHRGLRHLLSALREWDPRFGTALDAARAHGPDHHHDLLRWISIEPPTSSGLEDDLLAALAYAGAHEWWVGYGHLTAHHAHTDSTVVPHGHHVHGYPLGHWNFNNRSTYLRRGLPLDRYTALHALGAMADNQHDAARQRRWEQNIAAAQAFRARYHHLDVDLPGTHAPQSLRTWMRLVRAGAWPVTQTERATLDALGMLWENPVLLRRKAVAAAFADYHARHGNLEIPDDLVVDVRGISTRLLNWVSVFRREHDRGTLDPHVRRTLQDAGFVFDPDHAWWEDLITTARRHHELHGDLDVAPGAVHTVAGKCLLTVLQDCRTRWRRRSFDPDRAAMLDALDPLWGIARQPPAHPRQPAQPPPAPLEPTEQPVDRRPVPPPQPVSSASAAWNAGLQAAWRHRDRFGHLAPATDYRDPLTGLRLMPWLSDQRRARRSSRLAPEQIAALDALDMIWDPTARFRSLGIQHARSYHTQHGHLRVPSTAPYHGRDARGEPYNLYGALARARQDHAQGKLHPDWRGVLDELGYDYTADRSPLPGYVAVLEAYHAEHGNLDIAPQHPAHTCLKRLNDARGRSSLPEDLRQRLDAIGYGQDTRFTAWDYVFAVVLRFYNTHGHLDVPPDLRAKPLGGGKGTLVRPWLNNQRRRWRVGVITKQEKEKLDAVGFVWDLEEAEWMTTYLLAGRFQHEHGHLAVTKPHVRDNPEWAPLPGWLRTQNRLRAAHRLSDKRTTLLNHLGMPWVDRPGREHQWEQRLRQVMDFRRTHGHTHIIAHSNRTTDASERDELTKLAAWLNDQLVYAKRGTLRTDRREKLTAIGITVPMPPLTKAAPEGT